MNCRGVPSKLCHLKMYIMATLYTKRKICNQANIMKLIIPAVELAAGLQLTPEKKKRVDDIEATVPYVLKMLQITTDNHLRQF